MPSWGKATICSSTHGSDLLLYLQHGFERGQRRIGNINVGTDKLDAVGDLPLQRLPRAGFNVLMAQ